MTRKELQIVRRILDNGTYIPHHKASRNVVAKRCSELYWEVMALRKFILIRLVPELDGTETLVKGVK